LVNLTSLSVAHRERRTIGRLVNNELKRTCGRKRSWHRLRRYFGVYLAGLSKTTIPITTIITIIATVSTVVIIMNSVLGNVHTLRRPKWKEHMYKIWARGTDCISPVSFHMSQISLI
jgi:hypothetical protein